MRVDHAHRAVGAAVDQFARMQDRRIEAVAVPDHQLNAGALHRLDHGAAFLEPDRDRLFDQHMLAAGGGGDDMRGVHLMRGRDIDRLDGRIVAQRFDRVVGWCAEIRFEPLARFRAQIGRGDKLDPRDRPRRSAASA